MWLKRCLFRVLAKPRIKNKKDMKQQDAALVCFSGGQDSTTCLFWAKKHFSRVEAVCFTYGQKHSLEIEVARKIAADADVPFQLLDVSLISQLDPNCSLTNASIEMDQEKPEDSYPNTFVPGRNMVFLTFAAILARGKGIYHLVTGVSEADYSGYPDCRDTFVRSLNVTLNLAMWALPRLQTSQGRIGEIPEKERRESKVNERNGREKTRRRVAFIRWLYRI